MTKNLFRMIGLLGAALMLPVIAPQRAAADQDDPPGRVARLSYSHGEVSFQPAGTDEWVSAVVNRPLTTGDKLWTDKDARGELHIGSAAIRLRGETGFSFLNLNDNIAQIRLNEGSIAIHLRHLDDDETFEIDTPNLAFNLLRPGDYRLDVSEEGDTTVVTIRAGEGEVTGGGQAFTVHSDQRAVFSGTDQLVPDIDTIAGYDDFDNWCRNRDRREERSESARYVSRDVIGYEDLDEYGSWRPARGYGYVWVPRATVADWAPYRYGHWVWISPWGWTWVDDEPWGFAPFHYGRWVFVTGSWCWVPGPQPVVGVAYVRPVYSPALVAWVGGRNWGVGLAVGGGPTVGWVPLGPREVYVPSYHVSRTYVTNVNVTNTTVNNTYVTNVYNNTVVNQSTNINNVHINNVRYVNQSVPGAVTATSQATFTSARPVGRDLVHVDAKAAASAQVSTAAAPAVVPVKESLIGAGRPVSTAPPAMLHERPVVARTAPPPPQPAFERQQQAIQQNGGRPLAPSQIQRLEPARAQVTVTTPVKVVTPQTKPVPVEAGARDKGGRPNQPPQVGMPTKQEDAGRPAAAPAPQNQPNQPAQMNRPGQPMPQNQPGQPSGQPGAGNRPNREDRPPSAQPANRPQPNSDNKNVQPNTPNPKDRVTNPDVRPDNRNDRPDNRNNQPPSAEPANRPQPNSDNKNVQPNTPNPSDRPNKGNDRPDNRSDRPDNRNNRPPSAEPANRPQPNNDNKNVQPNTPNPSDRPNKGNDRPDIKNPDVNRPDRPAESPRQVEPNRPNDRPSNRNDQPNGKGDRPDGNNPNANRPDRPAEKPRQVEPDRKPQQEQQRPQQQQDQQRQKPDQKQQPQPQQQPQQQKVQQKEAKPKEKEKEKEQKQKPREDHPPKL